MSLSANGLFGAQQQAEIGRPKLVVRFQFEPLEYVVGSVASPLEIGLVLDVGFDFDVLADVVDRIEGDGVPLEREPFALLADRRGGLEARFVRIASVCS